MKRGTRKGVAYGTATAAAVAALLGLVLPQVTSAVKPTPAGTILLALAVGLVTIASQRYLECRKQQGVLDEALRTWPPRRLRTIPIEMLGVFPSSGDRSPYVRRDEDSKIEWALDRKSVVVVHGPPGAGKSRAAAEVARRKIGDYAAVIPVSADGLKSVADADASAGQDLGACVCVWLDDLDRFIDSLDCRLLEQLGGLADTVTVVTTVRTERWQELLGGTGEASAAARLFATEGEVVEVGPRSSAHHGAVWEALDASDAQAKPTVSPLWRDHLLRRYGIGLLAIIAVGLLVQFGGVFGGLLPPPSLTDQMNTITSQMVNAAGVGGGHVVLDERVPFHPADAESWVIAVEDNPTDARFVAAVANCDPRSLQSAAREACEDPSPRSNELRIYDVRGGRLRLAFDYRPPGVWKTAAQLVQVPGAGGWGNYDHSDTPQLVLAYEWPDGANTMLPLAIYWQDGKYKLQALTTAYPDGWPRHLDTSSRIFIKQAYRTEVHLPNAAGVPSFNRLRLDGYRVQAVALVQQPAVRLLTGYYPGYPSGYTQPKKLDLYAAQVRGDLAIALCTHTYYACRSPRGEEQVNVPPDRALDSALLDAWQQVGGLWRQSVKVTQVN